MAIHPPQVPYTLKLGPGDHSHIQKHTISSNMAETCQSKFMMKFCMLYFLCAHISPLQEEEMGKKKKAAIFISI